MVSLLNGTLHLLPNNSRPHSSDVPYPEHPPPPSILQHREEEQLIPYPLLRPRNKRKDPHIPSQPTLQSLLKPLFFPSRSVPQFHHHKNVNIPTQLSLQNSNKFYLL